MTFLKGIDVLIRTNSNLVYALLKLKKCTSFFILGIGLFRSVFFKVGPPA